MPKAHAYTFAAIALAFSLAAYAADPVTDTSKSQPAPEAKEVSSREGNASNPAKLLRAAIRADDMGYLYAVVNNPSGVAVANVYIVVVHFDEKTRQPDNQTIPLLVAEKLAPKQSAELKLEGMQVFKQVEFNSYRAMIQKAELAK